MTMTHTGQAADNTPDAVIIGGGPVGSYAALKLATLGAKVRVFEEHPEIGLRLTALGTLAFEAYAQWGCVRFQRVLLKTLFVKPTSILPQAPNFQFIFPVL